MTKLPRTPATQRAMAGASLAGMVGGVFLTAAVWPVVWGVGLGATPGLLAGLAVLAWLVARTVHELLHAAVHWAARRRVRIRLGLFAAAAEPVGPVPRNQQLASLLAPFLVVTAAALAGAATADAAWAWTLWLIVGGFNSLGSAQDLAEAFELIRFGPGSLIEDRPDGMVIQTGPEGD